ncbi:integrase [Acidovorax soli]|uniref:Integrase n=1 Tax=Acidovorax soli TaxID=592050 RepID=A0A7X0P949_9BURK|nr:integrase [Acidovorax soli]
MTDFSLYLIDYEHLDEKTVHATIDHLIRFSNYFLLNQSSRLANLGISKLVHSLEDSILEGFRDKELELVIKNSRSRQNERKAKATVNARLSAVYRWIWWMRQTGIISEHVAGPKGCSVIVDIRGPSRIARKSRGPLSGKVRNTPSSRHSLTMHLLFPDAEKRGKFKTGFVATRTDADSIVERLTTRNSSEYRNLRDALIVDLAVEVGFRVGSIASLRDSDFDKKKITTTAESTVVVTPLVQKYSYQNSFNIPVWLALRICALIEIRDEHLRCKGLSARVMERRIFVSERTLKPLTSRAISQQIACLLRSLGAPKGTSVHAFRALFCTEEIEREIDYRLARGLDTSAASICASVALKMGHSDPLSIFSYVSRALALRAARERASSKSSQNQPLTVEA